MNRVHDILAKKGGEVEAIPESASVKEAVDLMNERRIGALVVILANQVIGILSERDVLCRVIAEDLDPKQTKVSAVMTSPVAVVRRDTSLEDCKAVMTDKHVRHLPVVEEGRLLGIISSGDVMAYEAGTAQETIVYLYEYLYGTTP